MISEEKLNELCAKDLLELDRHTYGYATAGKDINAVLDRYVVAYKSGYRQAEAGAEELVEALNKIILIGDWQHKNIAEQSLAKWRERGV